MRAIILALVLVNAAYAGERLVQEDPILGKQPHKQQWVITQDGKICPVDMYGNREYHKPCLSTVKGK